MSHAIFLKNEKMGIFCTEKSNCRSEFKKAYLKKSNRRISKREIVQERQKTDYLENATSIERFYYISKQIFNSGFHDIMHFWFNTPSQEKYNFLRDMIF